MDIQDIAIYFNELSSHEGQSFSCQLLPGELDVLQITVENRDEFPIYLSVTEDQILCLSYLFDDEQVISEKQADLNEAMLAMNIPMPLSSFAKISNRFVVFGALSLNSSLEDVAHEVVVLSDNCIDAVEAMSDFLK